MILKEIGPLAKLVCCKPIGSKLQVTYRVEAGANLSTLRDIFEGSLLPVRTEIVWRRGNDVTYAYDFDNEQSATAAAIAIGVLPKAIG